MPGRADQPGAYDAELGEGWRIGDGVNGGLLLALAGHALRRELGPRRRLPGTRTRSRSAPTTSPPRRPGPATLRTEVLRAGRAVSTGQVSLLQRDGDGADVERVRVLATYGDLDTVARTHARTAAYRRTCRPPDALPAGGGRAPDLPRHAVAAGPARPAARPGHRRAGRSGGPSGLTAASAAGYAWPTAASPTR